MWIALAGMAAALTSAQPGTYRADLGPMPLDDETKAVIAGRGEATATITGRQLAVTGDFHGLPSPATAAYLLISPAIGVPGTKLLPLQVSGQGEGIVSGRASLTPEQLRALRTGRLYIQLNSEKAPPGYSWGPKGTLWGWLLPAHERAEPGVPQQGRGFVPQLDTPSR